MAIAASTATRSEDGARQPLGGGARGAGAL